MLLKKTNTVVFLENNAIINTVKQNKQYIERNDVMRYFGHGRDCSDESASGRAVFAGIRKLLVVFAAVAMIFVFCTGMSSSKQKQYLSAVTAMDNGDYLTAIESFEALNGYKDSKTLIKECYYQYAGELFDEGKIKSASVIYQDLSGYKDADTYIQMCSDAGTYNDALDLYEKGEYMSAYLALGTMSGKYKDSRQLEAKCVLNITKQHYEDKDYEEAYDWYCTLQDCKSNLPKGTDTAFTKKVPVRYAETLINTKKDASINEGLKILKSLKSTEEIKKLINKGNKQLNQNKYDAAKRSLDLGYYETAVKQFEELKDFSDAKKQKQAAMYGYVQKNKKYGEQYKSTSELAAYPTLQNTVKTFYKYAESLSKSNYKDSKAYYKKLTAWKVDIVMNGDVDSVTSATSVSKYDYMCAHLKLSGGPLDGKTKVKYEFTFPDGSKTSGSFDDKWKEGYSGTCWCYYNNPSKGKTGTCSVKIRDGNGNVIGKSSIKVR